MDRLDQNRSISVCSRSLIKYDQCPNRCDQGRYNGCQCTCSIGRQPGIVNCQGLIFFFHIFQSYSGQATTIPNSVFPAFTPDYDVIDLNVGDNQLKTVEATYFINMTSLITLKLFNCSIESIKSSAFVELNQLESLFLTRNKLTRISNRALTGLVNLRSLYLARNSIAVVEADAFAETTNVEFIDFAYNNLTHLSGVNLAPLEKLEILDLSNNQLVTIGIRDLSPLRNLKFISLHNNAWSCTIQSLCFLTKPLVELHQAYEKLWLVEHDALCDRYLY